MSKGLDVSFNKPISVSSNETKIGRWLSRDGIHMVIFYAEWCPHSRKALAKLRDLKSKFLELGIKYKLTNRATDTQRFNINAYPTIIYSVDGKWQKTAGHAEEVMNRLIEIAEKRVPPLIQSMIKKLEKACGTTDPNIIINHLFSAGLIHVPV